MPPATTETALASYNGRALIHVKKFITLLLAGLLAGGCTSSMYRHWADKQVDAIVRDRERRTLDYTPQVDAEMTVPSKPEASAYAKIPPTPKPPPTTSPIEPSDVELRYGRLGPEILFPAGVFAPQTSYGLEAAQMRDARLVLGPPTPGQEILRLDLFGSLRYSVLNSRAYKSRMEDLYLAALDVTLQRHLFEPRPFASTGLRYTGGQGAANYAAAMTAINTLGVRQQLPYGGEVAAAATVDFVRAISGTAENGESADITLSASIPLLRGAGLVNLEPLIQTERQMVYEVRSFEDFRRDFVVTIASQYFDLLTDQQSIANRAANLLSLQSLTARTQAMFAAGRLNQIDVQRSLQEQLQAEQDLIDAQASYRSAVDDFKIVLGIPVDQPIEVIAQELAVNIPRFAEAEVTELALRYRLDLRTAEDQVEDARRNVQVSKNQLLPDLDLRAAGSFGNNPGTPAAELNNDQTDYSASLTLEIPLDRLAERNRFRQSLIQLERSQRSFQLLRDQVAGDARNSLRLIQSAQISLEIQRKGIELARLRLENANELLRQGKKDSRDVVDAQNALLRAQDAFVAANAALQIQVLRFLRDTGTLRLDPDAGAIGAALDRKAAVKAVNEPKAGG
jgi:hypothetical protein